MTHSLPILRPLLLALSMPVSALSCLSFVGPSASSPTGPVRGPWVYVTNEGSGDLSVIDAARDEVVATIAVGSRPRAVRVDADGRRVYAAVTGTPRSRPGLSPAFIPPSDRAEDGIAIVDAPSRRLLSRLPAGADPESFDLVAGGRRLVVSNEGGASASVVDVDQARVLATVPVGDAPAGVTVAPGGRLAAVASERLHEVDLVDPAAGKVIARIPTCLRPRSVVFSRSGALAFAPCEDGAAVAVIDVRLLRPLDPIPLPAGSRPSGAALSPDGRKLYVANGAGGTVSVVDVANRAVSATSTSVGAQPSGIAVTPDGRKLYVTDGPSNYVAVLDAATLAPLRRIRAGTAPWGVAIAPD